MPTNDIAAAIIWHAANIRTRQKRRRTAASPVGQPPVGGNGSATPHNVTPYDRRQLALAAIAEHQVALLDGRNVDAEAMLATWQSILVTVRNKLLAIPGRAAPLLVGVSSTAKAEAIIRKLVHEALKELASDERQAN